VFSKEEVTVEGIKSFGWLRVFSQNRVVALGAIMVCAGWQSTQTASAQPATGSISGTVRDSAGAAVTGAQLSIRSLTTDQTQTSATDSAGLYKVQNLTAGSYEITVSKYGFENAKARLVTDAHRPVHLDLKLTLAAVSDAGAPQAAPASAESKRLQALEERIEQLEAELKKGGAPTVAAAGPAAIAAAASPVVASGAASAAPASAAAAPVENTEHSRLLATVTRDPSQIPILPSTGAKTEDKKTVAVNSLPPTQSAPAQSAPPQNATASQNSSQNPAPAPPTVDLQTPFAYGDFTWLNGSPRNKDVVLDTPFFTPEVRFDTHYMEDLNQPIDHTIVGSTESFRSGEVQIEQASVGGDFHWQNVRGRILFMMGMFATTTPRNDASSATGSAAGNTGGVGQWDLQNAYKYVSEAYGGYHFNVQHGLNVDAGIFVSYVGLFSYYNFDNWTYQPSYVSSNTPWFFEGVRVQWFPTNKLKIEPWFINGWQSYAKYNHHPGLGGQLLWMPREWFKLVANQYGYGEDNLGLPHTERIHTDDSIEVRYYNNPESPGLSKMAFSLTGDAGCQYGGGIQCTGAPSKNKSSFLGWMGYERMWFHKDLLALTVGGGQMNNWGRYLTLLPPIDGAWAASGTPYFTENAGQAAHMWDSTINLQYMPKQYITWWLEAGYRHSDVPYFAGRGGVTPPGGNNGFPQYYTCNSGATAGTADLAAAYTACGGPGSVWFPDLRKSEAKISLGVMVKF
jgi:hypothetical protein